VPILAWGIWIELSGRVCPLTPLENELLQRAGESGYRGDFIVHYALPVLYPLGLTRHVQWLLAALLLSLNATVYGRLLLHTRRTSIYIGASYSTHEAGCLTGHRPVRTIRRLNPSSRCACVGSARLAVPR
jgi:hypothetical protein